MMPGQRWDRLSILSVPKQGGSSWVLQGGFAGLGSDIVHPKPNSSPRLPQMKAIGRPKHTISMLKASIRPRVPAVTVNPRNPF